MGRSEYHPSQIFLTFLPVPSLTSPSFPDLTDLPSVPAGHGKEDTAHLQEAVAAVASLVVRTRMPCSLSHTDSRMCFAH